jgi:Fe-S-cluster containining protein
LDSLSLLAHLAPLPSLVPPLPRELPQITEAPLGTTCRCRCGVCCREMAVIATDADVDREPRIGIVGHVMPPESDHPGKFFLNVLDPSLRGGFGPCKFLNQEPGRPAECTIYETRPDVCRSLDCDALQEYGRAHMAKWQAEIAAADRIAANNG